MSHTPGRIRIGTRGSKLALWQADHVAHALSGVPGVREAEKVLIKTEGDQIQDVPLWKVEGKAFFTKEIEEALLKERVDVAVHSLKDLATQMPPGLVLGAVLEREDPRDVVLFSPSLTAKLQGTGRAPDSPDSAEGSWGPEVLPYGARVGTSSLRRRAFLARWRPDVELLDLRGNVPTRIKKLDGGDYDAIVLAAAGVMRLGLSHRISAYLPFDFFLPAVSQGAIGIQIREGDTATLDSIKSLEHAQTRLATSAERAFLGSMEGGCQVPVGAFAEVEAGALTIRGMVCSLDGSRSVEGEARGDARGEPEEAESLGEGLGGELLAAGGDRILKEIREASDDG